MAQQRAFDRWRRTYNQERPHEALGQRPPASVYAVSHRSFESKERPWPNRFDCEQLAVDRNGEVSVGRGKVFISTALKHHYVDCRPGGDRSWEVSFGPIVLGLIDRSKTSRGLIRPKKRSDYLDLSTMFPV